jgi:hypothetical protein
MKERIFAFDENDRLVEIQLEDSNKYLNIANDNKL